MGGKKGGENSKKAEGNARKAQQAAAKVSEAERKKEAEESQQWQKGAKDNSKKEAAEQKAAEAAKKKAEKDALLKAEEDSQPSKPSGAGKKSAQKKGSAPARGLDLSQLDALGPPGSKKQSEINASGIDNALDALSLTTGSGANEKVDRHPERRFKAAYAAYEERRLEEMKDDKSLRRQQKTDLIRKEFEKSPENPFNQALAGQFDMTGSEMAELRQQKMANVEARLTGP